MSTLPRPTGKELVRALERAGYASVRIKGSHYFLRQLRSNFRNPCPYLATPAFATRQGCMPD